jgi:hypothetical protein
MTSYLLWYQFNAFQSLQHYQVAITSYILGRTKERKRNKDIKEMRERKKERTGMNDVSVEYDLLAVSMDYYIVVSLRCQVTHFERRSR